MEQITKSKKGLIFLTVVIYIIHLLFNYNAAQVGPESKLFPNSIANVSKEFHVEMMPVPEIFAIWGVIFILQLCWMTYAITTVFRSGPTANILSNGFFIAFICNILCNTVWLFTWSHKEGVISFAVILLGQLFIDIAIGISFYDLKEFLDDNKEYRRGNADIWTQRILVHNALLFYGTWTTIATMINFAVVLQYYMGLSSIFASFISLSLLGVLSFVWFLLENVVLSSYMPYTFATYIVMLIGSLGMATNIFNIDKSIGALVLCILMLTSICLLIRSAIVIFCHTNKPGTADLSTLQEKHYNVLNVSTECQISLNKCEDTS